MPHRRFSHAVSITLRTYHSGLLGSLPKYISSTSDRLYCARTVGLKRCGPWHWYLRFTDERPLLTAIATGAVLWGIGDIVAQKIEVHQPPHTHSPGDADPHPEHGTAAAAGGLEYRRLCATSVFGSVIAGGLGLYWYRYLDTMMASRFAHGSFRFVAGKLSLEFLLWHPFTLTAYWGLTGALEGRSIAEIGASLRKEFLPTIGSEYILWTPIDILNFWLVPVSLQVLVVNLGSLVEAMLLSYVHANGFPLMH